MWVLVKLTMLNRIKYLHKMKDSLEGEDVRLLRHALELTQPQFVAVMDSVIEDRSVDRIQFAKRQILADFWVNMA